MHWAECVPNVSDGRSRVLRDQFSWALEASGAELLDSQADPDHNRSVFTLVAPLSQIRAAVLSLAELAVAHIDLTRHQGVHPRIGALDVVPIVPIDDMPRHVCVETARSIGESLWDELHIPVYFYGAAARRAHRTSLESFRRHGFEKLATMVRSGGCLPDVGGPDLHPTAGACCVGVREVMAAFNVLLDARDASAAKRIARAIRESDGGIEGVKALGLYLASAQVAQVSMNLTDLRKTPLPVAFKAVSRAARKLGVPVLGSELVGLVPRHALGPNPASLRIRRFHSGMVLEDHLECIRRRMNAEGPGGSD